MKTVKFLFWLGIIIMVVGIIGNGYTFIRAIGEHGGVVYNTGAFVVSLLSPVWQGGILVGIAKIIEKLFEK
jgi:hypothetical protein